MKKNEKRIFVIAAIAKFMEWNLTQHPAYKTLVCHNNFNCDGCNKCEAMDLMVSLYDANHEHIASNWSINSGQIWEDACSGTINKAADSFNVNINHFMWGLADEFLHKIRYIRIGYRNTIETEDGYFMEREHGWEYELFSGFIEPYHDTWMAGPPEINEEWNNGCF